MPERGHGRLGSNLLPSTEAVILIGCHSERRRENPHKKDIGGRRGCHRPGHCGGILWSAGVSAFQGETRRGPGAGLFCQRRLSQRVVERAAGAAGQFQQSPGLPHHGRTGGCRAFPRHAGLVPAAGEIIPRHHQQTSAGLRRTAVSKPALSAHQPGARRFVRVRRQRAGLSHCFRGTGFEPASPGGGGNPV